MPVLGIIMFCNVQSVSTGNCGVFCTRAVLWICLIWSLSLLAITVGVRPSASREIGAEMGSIIMRVVVNSNIKKHLDTVNNKK